jgi:hypothetical protein
MSALYRAMIAEARGVVEGTATAPAPDRALHEAGHATVALALGITVVHTTLRRTPHCGRAHTCTAPAADRVHRAAVAWGGALAEGTMAYAEDDFLALAELGQHRRGPAFDLAEAIVAEHRESVRRIAAALLDPAREGVIFGEEIAALLTGPAPARGTAPADRPVRCRC